jgi:hypothetical protein
MTIREDLGAFPQPLRWLAALWLRARSSARVGLSPLSSDWLLDLERQTIRGRDF